MDDSHNPAASTVAVIGLGKIGLPLAALFARNGYHVIGADIDPTAVAAVNQGTSHIDNEPGLANLITAARHANTLAATTNTAEAVAQADIIVVIVPVLTDDQNKIDYRSIDQAVKTIAQGLQKDSLVIFETTLPPGDTENRFGKMIEETSGWQPGKDVDLAYSPERVYANQIIHDLEHYPKVIGGINDRSRKRAAAFYQKALGCPLIDVRSLETAEFAKIAECVYRDVNIALANELAMFADRLDVHMPEVLQASNSQPYAHIHSPGIGVGGHCIPVYPYFFINQGLNTGLVPLSRQVNDGMANYAINKIEKQIGALDDKTILILGLSYRGDVKEPAKSTALLLIEELKNKGAHPFVHDPLFSDEDILNCEATPLTLNSQACADIDGVILQAFHKQYSELDFSQFPNCQIVLDGRNQLNKQDITRHGITYAGIGNTGGDGFDTHPYG
ncbi:nucleotide sugar dehydrogenase [Barrientosiimonas marina]|uniref:Nucleotide sugar dehydrogenase n=1 Tax=Lentibacillus kimchii TaxID=1542911 RepID=A0ABW2USF4_9BACI